MPGRDGTGPMGTGPMSGWGRGWCGRGRACGYGGFYGGRGFGRMPFGMGMGMGRGVWMEPAGEVDERAMLEQELAMAEARARELRTRLGREGEE